MGIYLLEKKLFLLVLALLYCCSGNAMEMVCGKTRVEYNLGPHSIYGYESVDIKVFSVSNELLSEMIYDWVHFSLTCFTNEEKEKFVVYKAYCGGSGCDDSSNFGVISAESGEQLLVPTDNNRRKAKDVLGDIPSEL